MCDKEQFIYASSRPWHRPYFDRLQQRSGAEWLWVSTPDELERALATARPRYIFFAHWNWLVPEAVWRVHECVCFHMTDVPYGRGGSPLQNLILAGHAETKLTALRMVEEMDAGPVYTKRDLALDGSAEEIYTRATALSVEIMEWMIATRPQPVAQQGEPVMFKRRKPAQSKLPAQGSSDQLYDFIRMLDAEGYPHAFLEHGKFKLEFRKAQRDGQAIVAEVRITPIPHEVAHDGH